MKPRTLEESKIQIGDVVRNKAGDFGVVAGLGNILDSRSNHYKDAVWAFWRSSEELAIEAYFKLTPSAAKAATNGGMLTFSRSSRVEIIRSVLTNYDDDDLWE